MEDLRNRYRAPRRDYGLPAKPVQPPVQPPIEQPQPEVTDHPAHPQVQHRPKRALLLAVLVLAGLLAVGLWTYPKSPKTLFPADIASTLSYPIYYPPNSVNGYSYQVGSAKIKAGILFYTMANRSKKILITEQNAPTTAINLNSLPNHSPLNVAIGRAVIGTGLGNPSVVIVTSSTLIQLTSTKGVTKTDIINVAKAMGQQSNNSTTELNK